MLFRTNWIILNTTSIHLQLRTHYYQVKNQPCSSLQHNIEHGPSSIALYSLLHTQQRSLSVLFTYCQTVCISFVQNKNKLFHSIKIWEYDEEVVGVSRCFFRIDFDSYPSFAKLQYDINIHRVLKEAVETDYMFVEQRSVDGDLLSHFLFLTGLHHKFLGYNFASINLVVCYVLYLVAFCKTTLKVITIKL